MTGDWFRRTAWAAEDQRDFRARLARARAENRAQYLRIQAGTLAGHDRNNVPFALALLDELLETYPESLEVATALSQKAKCLYELGEVEAAADAYAASAQRMRDVPKMVTDGWLDFALMVAIERLHSRYDEVLAILDEFAADWPLMLASQHFRLHASRALIAAERGDGEAAGHAALALEAAEATDSGMPRRRSLGLVRGYDDLRGRLESLSGARGGPRTMLARLFRSR
jgi:tetratricopeptide (TPR) repeat protein